MNHWLLLLFASLVLASGCIRKPELPTAPPTNGAINDTLYVPVSPEWTGFNNPSDILIGAEPFVYIADTDNSRIVMLDLAGRLVGNSAPIKNPSAITQDGFFDLLVCGELDTLGTTVGAVYRISLRESLHDISRAPVKLVYAELGRPGRRFTGIATLPDNSYLVARSGPSNSSAVDPDDAIIVLSKGDSLINRVASLVPVGNALSSLVRPNRLLTFRNRTQDFMFSQRGQEMQFKVQWLTFVTGDVSDWVQKFDPVVPLWTPNRFSDPFGLATDLFGNVYVADAGTDSVYRFTSQGREFYSFGGSGNGPRQFSDPKGVAWFNRTLYVADSRNNRVLRFRLSTDN